MKKDKFISVFKNIEPDSHMDKRITDKLISYNNQHHKNSFRILRTCCYKLTPNSLLSKVAAALLLITVTGTVTAVASSYYYKSYKADFNIMNTAEAESARNAEGTTSQIIDYTNSIVFGSGHDIHSDIKINGDIVKFDSNGEYVDKEGNVYYSPYEKESSVEEDIQSGNDAFAQLGLSNLIPSYLYDNYLLEKGGYHYTDNGDYKILSCGFFSNAADYKYVFIQYSPLDTSAQNVSCFDLLSDNLTEADCDSSTYETKSGLVCNILTDKVNHTVTANIVFDSEDLGSGNYLLSFFNTELDEIKTILDSIPIS